MRIALAQLTSSRSLDDNLALVRTTLAEAGRRRADVVVFPEATMRAFGNSLSDIAEPLDGPWAAGVREAADAAGVVAVVGMFTPGEGGRVRNTLLVHGRGVEAHYDKIHLYDAFGFLESDTVTAGKEPVTFTVDGVTFGLATCYDLRFPDLFTATADEGAQIQLVPASWGAGPGKAEQWDLLVRARALDSTCFVVAVGQSDPEAAGVEAKRGAPTGIGRSAVASPLGHLIERLGSGPDTLYVDLDPAEVERARTALPVLANRVRL
ncbi:apolipoprotein acyltransferase [Sinomonas cellulolyticus]|jgi:predicted amidohydrolase|uniref:Carbon-nitrogen hydrolase family protein n=1 Tax=Sinomonas cellulolyticus TaxID=2801916 RepID=A0ABS1K652_9MICC|nr:MULTISPECIES: carbon-nitrogen hydrolase family protein [Sinomonas]MBL0705776.1 carbon-nitrogen hydrolase family protein [Sinomonas cellulolyticus]GHG41946.1 apolipoprotein acyltransferase [Sinomonas sp. KCTC 49339]